MHKALWASAMGLAAVTLVTEARADGANLHSADVLRPGDNMLYGEVGWPDMVFGFQHGMSDKVDIGFRFAFIYGFEYTPGVRLGLGMSVPIRITPLKREKVSVQIHFDPGLKFDGFGNDNCALNRNCPGDYGYYGGGLAFGLSLGVGVDVGIHLTREATLSFGLNMPIYINFTNGVYGAIPLLFGPAFEYHIDEHMSVGGNVKLGPSILAACGPDVDVYGDCVSHSGADIGFITQAYFAYRL